MSENKAISCKEDTANESEDDETEGADEVSEDCEDQDEDHASTIQADVEDDSESLDPRIQVSTFLLIHQIFAWFVKFMVFLHTRRY